MTHPILMITSQISGLLYANGRFVGEVSPGEQLTLPVSPQGALYLEYYPLTHGYCMLARRLQFTQGMLTPGGDMHSGLYIVAWPGMLMDVQIMPDRQYAPETGGAMLLSSGEYTLSVDVGRAYAHVYRGNPSLYTLELPENATELRCLDMQQGRVMLTGHCSEGEFLTLVDVEHGRELASLRGARIEPLERGAIRVTRPADDIAGHELSEIWELRATGYELANMRVGWQTGCPRTPTAPEATALALVQALKLNCMAEAAGYVAAHAQPQLNEYARLCEWGDMGVPLKYASAQRDKPAAIGLMKLLEPGYARVIAVEYSAEPQPGEPNRYMITRFEKAGVNRAS